MNTKEKIKEIHEPKKENTINKISSVYVQKEEIFNSTFKAKRFRKI